MKKNDILFNKKILNEIKNTESSPKIFKNFLKKKEIEELINIEKKSSYFVNRDDGRKRGFGKKGNIPVRNPKNWDPRIKKILYKKIKNIIPNAYVPKDEFPPHFFYTTNPTMLHADTGINKNSIIYKQIMIPLEIVPSKKSCRTIIFKEKWYGKASFFQKEKAKKNIRNFYLLDVNQKFIKIKQIKKFYSLIKDVNGKYLYKKNIFLINKIFKQKVLSMIKKKRFNQVTNAHIKKDKKLDNNFYNQHLTHQPIQDFDGLNVDLNYKWKPGEALVWDRSRIHASDNYVKNGVKKKLGIAIFFNRLK